MGRPVESRPSTSCHNPRPTHIYALLVAPPAAVYRCSRPNRSRRGTRDMMRTGLLWLSNQPKVFSFVRRNGIARRFAARVVAGETVDTAVTAARDLNRRKITATLDLLGESITSESEAAHA